MRISYYIFYSSSGAPTVQQYFSNILYNFTHYSSTGASTGQTPAHVPHEIQAD